MPSGENGVLFLTARHAVRIKAQFHRATNNKIKSAADLCQRVAEFWRCIADDQLKFAHIWRNTNCDLSLSLVGASKMLFVHRLILDFLPCIHCYC